MTKLKTLKAKLHQIQLKPIQKSVRAHQFRAKLGLNLHSVYSIQLQVQSTREPGHAGAAHMLRQASCLFSEHNPQTGQLPLKTDYQSLHHSPRAPEILFKPELIGRDHYGMHESLFKSILSSDIDLRRSFLGNIVLSGNSCFLLVCKCYTTVSGLQDAFQLWQ